MVKRPCKQCGRALRGAGVLLYHTPRGKVYVHKRCFTAYNDAGVDEPCGCGAHPPRAIARARRRRAA